MNEVSTEVTTQTMTVREVADILRVSTDTVKNCIRRILPNKMQNGKTTYLNEAEVSLISKELKSNTKVTEQLTYEAASQVKNTTTELEVLGNALAAFKALQDLYNQKENEYKAVIAQKDNQLLEQKPKVEFYDAVTGSDKAIDMGQVAKVLNIDGFGRTRLFKFLRDKNILDRRNIPYQRYVEQGYFRVIESKFDMPDGSVGINLKTVVFQKGVDYIRKLVDSKSA